MGLFRLIEGMVQARLMGKTAGGSQVQVKVDDDGVIQLTFPPHALVGANHEASGLTVGHVLRATAEAAFAFQAIQSEDLPKPIELERASADNLVLTAKVTGDTYNRLEIYADGTIKLGDGTAADAFFGRLAAGLLGDSTTKIWTPDRKGLAEGRLERKDVDTARLVGFAGTSKLISVKENYTSLTSDIERALTAGNYLLNADGSISTTNPAADTLYHAYLLGPGHSTNPNELRFCATGPADGYLGDTGDAAHCRHVGWIRTNTSTQILANGHIVSRLNMMFDRIGNSITANEWFSNTQASTWEDIGVTESFLWPPNIAILIIFNVISYHGAAGQGNMARISLVQKGETSLEPYWVEPVTNYRMVHTGFHYSRNGASPVYETIKVQGWTGQVSPDTSSFHKKNTSTDFVVLFLPEELAS